MEPHTALKDLAWRAIHQSPVDSHHKASVMRTFDVSFTVSLNKQQCQLAVILKFLDIQNASLLCIFAKRQQLYVVIESQRHIIVSFKHAYVIRMNV